MSRKLVFGLLILLSASSLAVVLFLRDGAPLSIKPVTDADLYAAKLSRGEVPASVQQVPEAIIPLKKTVRLAIGSLGFPDNEQNQQLGDLIVAQLAAEPGLELIERQELDAVLREQQLKLSGLVRAGDAVQTGKLLRADWFLLGTSAQIHETNCLVLRLVDAKTGITRDGVVLNQASASTMAKEVADFVRQARRAAAEAKVHTYLAIGVFQNISVNGRQASFPAQLRGYLTAAYRKSRFTLLEREYADLLLQEMQLDLAGLTEDRRTNSAVPMPSAFWLVDGTYQSYETTNVQLELALGVHRIFSTTKYINLRSLPGEAACRQIKDSIDSIIGQNSGLFAPTRTSEARSQLMAGKELVQSDSQNLLRITDGGPLLYNLEGGWSASPRDLLNLREAIRAFETVLLLDPTNCEAKVYLAACLQVPPINQLTEARNYYRQVIEDKNTGDRLAFMARYGLKSLFDLHQISDAERASWYESAANGTDNPKAATFYQHEADDAKTTALLESGGAKAQAFVAEKLLESITNAVVGNIYGLMGTETFLDTFGTNRAAAAEKLAELYPRLKAQAPDYEAYLLAAVVTGQVDTNAPVVLEFQQMLTNLAEHPEKVFRSDQFWWHVPDAVFHWSFDHKLYGMAADIMEGKARAALLYPKHVWGFTDEDRMNLAFACLAGNRWKSALDIFETCSNRPFVLGNRGPWGPAFTVLLPGEYAASCRQKLGLPPLHDPRQFEMGKPCLNFPVSAFAIDADGIWVATSDRLLQLDSNLNIKRQVTLPSETVSSVSCICDGSVSIWLGTAGRGLIEFDKQSGKVRLLTEKDGLLMDSIFSLHSGGGMLWIGYGDVSAGGVGRLDLTTHQITSFSPSLSVQSPSDRLPIVSVAAGIAGDVWYLPKNGCLRHYRSSDNFSEEIRAKLYGNALISDNEHLVVGHTWNYDGHDQIGSLGVNILNFKKNQWLNPPGTEGIPPGTVTTVTLVNRDLWVGGMAYIALVDLDLGTVRKFAHVPSQGIGSIQVGDGFLWALYSGCLHRTPLSALE